MHEAMEHGDGETAREISHRMFPLTQAIRQAMISSGVLTSSRAASRESRAGTPSRPRRRP